MHILHLNGRRLAKALRSLGHTVLTMGPADSYDRHLDLREYTLEKALALCPFTPDLVLAESQGNRPFVLGLEQCPYPVAALVVDAPLNLFWLRHWGRTVDFLFADQKDSALELARHAIPAHWLPLSVDPDDFPEPGGDKEYDILFIGRREPDRLKRAFLLQTLSKHFRVTAMGPPRDPWMSVAEMARHFSRAKLVLNENMFNGVSLRMFQAMASGSLLFTEDADNGLADLFQDGRHLAAFGPENVLEKAARYLEDDEGREAVARRGREEVLAHHTDEHRARAILDAVASGAGRIPRPPAPEQQAELARAYLNAAQRFDNQASVLVPQALRAAENALAHDLPPQARALALATRGLLKAKFGKDDPLPDLLAAARAEPENPDHAFTLAHAHRLAGDTAASIREFRRGFDVLSVPREPVDQALDHADDPARFALDLGRCFQEAGRLWEYGFSKTPPEDFPGNAVDQFALALRLGAGAQGLEELARIFLATNLPGQSLAYSLTALQEGGPTPERSALANVAAKKIYGSHLPGRPHEWARRLKEQAI